MDFSPATTCQTNYLMEIVEIFSISFASQIPTRPPLPLSQFAMAARSSVRALRSGCARAATVRQSSTAKRESVHSHETQHYKEVTSVYDSNFFYGPEMKEFQVNIVKEIVSKGLAGKGSISDLSFADLGGGTGVFSSLVHKTLGLKKDILCIDPSKSMLAKAKDLEGVQTLCCGALEFAEGVEDASFDVVLMKEMIHHLDLKEAGQVFSKLKRGMKSGGQCVLMTRPLDPDYPFFDKAMKVWKDNATSSKTIMDLLTKAGFEKANATVHSTPVVLNKEKWMEMVRSRFWSTFSRAHFNDEELGAGIEEIGKRYAANKDGSLTFEERMVVVQAIKP